MNSMKRRSARILLGAFALASGMVFGSGFAILEQSPRGLGASFAGMAAKIDDPGALYFNPAVSAWFKESQLMLGTTILRASATFANDGSTHFDGTTPIQGNNGGNAGGYSLIPNFYLIQPLGERWAFGLGITATSGTETEWDWHWVGRYQAIKTAASTIDISPSLSWMATDNLSIGAALNIQYMQFEKINKVDGYSAALSMAQGLIATGIPAYVDLGNAIVADIMSDPSFQPGTMDSTLEINEDSLSFGWSVGMLFQPAEGTRLGLSYRSRISHSPKGDAKFLTPDIDFPTADMSLAEFYQTVGMLVDTDTKSDMDLPPMVAFGLSQRLTDDWTLLLDVERTFWSTIETVTTIFDSNQHDHITRFEWQDTWRVALGFEWDYSEDFTFRFGGAWDQSPGRDRNFRTPRMPDVNRYWASCGMTYRFSETLEFDIAYMHLFMDKGKSEYNDENTHQTLSGTYTGRADLLSFGMIWKY